MKKVIAASTRISLTVAIMFPLSTQAVVNPDAPEVKLRLSCGAAGQEMDDCFTSVTALSDWINQVRTPNAAAPLQVTVAPGSYSGFLTCVDASHVSIKGAGPENTIIQAIQGKNCHQLNVQDLTVSNSFIGVYWMGEGSSFWTNVHVRDGLYAWSETCGSTTERASHYWFGSRLHGKAKTYLASCSENWIFGSEIVASGDGLGGSLKALLTLQQTTTPGNIIPEIHVYGSVIRTIAAPGKTYGSPAASIEGEGLLAAHAGTNSKIHIHGTGIDVIGNDVANDLGVLAAANGGMIHANESSYSIEPGSAGGAVVRITTANGGHVHAPYAWQHIPDFDLASVTGADTAILASGTSDGHPHLVIYDSNCPGQWYDATDKSCLP